MPKIKFNRDYDYRWPSRAVTAFKQGETYTVKREVLEVALSVGAAVEVSKKDSDIEQVSEGLDGVDAVGGIDSEVDGDALLAVSLD
jgi:hypothetical protein